MPVNFRKAAIIGCGFVGASIAFRFLQQGLFSQLVLLDANRAKAEGEAMDLSDGLPYGAAMQITAGGYDDLSDCALVVITAGANQKPGESRLDLIDKNTAILRSILGEITARPFEGILLIVSNPVDVLTQTAWKLSGYPRERVIGSGTVLDTARLQAELAKELHISPKNVHAHVYGEHGDSSFVPWSLAHIANNHIACYKGHAPHGEEIAFSGEYEAFAEKVRTSGAVVIKAKGVTNYAIAMAVCHIVRCIFNGAGTALTISTMMNGEYGIEDVCLSVLNLVDSKGVRGKIQNDLTPEELEKLKYSASKLKETIAAITY